MRTRTRARARAQMSSPTRGSTVSWRRTRPSARVVVGTWRARASPRVGARRLLGERRSGDFEWWLAMGECRVCVLRVAISARSDLGPMVGRRVVVLRRRARAHLTVVLPRIVFSLLRRYREPGKRVLSDRMVRILGMTVCSGMGGAGAPLESDSERPRGSLARRGQTSTRLRRSCESLV